MSNGPDRIGNLVTAAQNAMRDGRHEEAAQLWAEVLSTDSEHPQALFHLGQHALMRKDTGRARQLLQRAAKAAPREPAIPLNLSFVHRATGNAPAEMTALTDALAIDPYFFPALLAKGMLLERMGEKRKAARVYKDVLTIAPPEDQVAAELRGPLRHARESIDENAAELDAYLHARLHPVVSRHEDENLSRFEECREIALGRRKVYTQQPSMLHVPRLPTIQFYERADFPWLSEFEAASDVIRDEFLAVLREDMGGMRPYVSHPDGAPLNQWAELNHSLRWSVFFLWEHGKRIEDHCARCPRTVSIVENLPLMELAGLSPNVMFSLLAPHTRIPSHFGDTNARLVGHLPLILPGNCRFRVGNEIREWRYGEAWFFDDTIEHEAWNDSDEVRVILIIDTWNPYLTHAERELVAALLNGVTDYYRDQPAPA